MEIPKSTQNFKWKNFSNAPVAECLNLWQILPVKSQTFQIFIKSLSKLSRLYSIRFFHFPWLQFLASCIHFWHKLMDQVTCLGAPLRKKVLQNLSHPSILRHIFGSADCWWFLFFAKNLSNFSRLYLILPDVLRWFQACIFLYFLRRHFEISLHFIVISVDRHLKFK